MPTNFAVAVFGVPDFEQRVLERIFSISESRDYVYKIVSRPSQDAIDIALVDKANAKAFSEFQRFVAGHGGIPTITIANTATSDEKYSVRRPLTAAHMLGVLDRVVGSELTHSGDDDAAIGDAPPCAPAETAEPRQRLGGRRALVVDDSLPVRKQVGVAVQKAGLEADFAESGEAALEMLAKNRYDIVFLDVVLPGIDGYEVCKSVKRDKSKKHIPIIMLTGRTSPFDKVKGKLSGCDTYLTKPVSVKEFMKTINKCLDQPVAFDSV